MSTLKTYRASQRIAAEHKSCPSCAQRIRVGMPIVFLPPANDSRAKAVAHHVGCCLHRMEGAS